MPSAEEYMDDQVLQLPVLRAQYLEMGWDISKDL